MLGLKSRRKGMRREREFAELVGGERVPLSGAAGGKFGQDVELPNGWRIEVKSRANGFNLIYRWLEGADGLALKADYKDWLVVLPIGKFLELSRGKDGKRL
jgi:hypothetical protein